MSSALVEESISSKKDVVILSSAPPPPHSIALIVIGGFILINSLPTWKSIDEVATVQLFTRRIFPDTISLYQLAGIRLFLAALIWSISLQLIFSEGWVQITAYLEGSKLIKAPNRLQGIKTMFPFTSLSWNLLGVSFSLSGYIALQHAINPQAEISRYILRSALIFWEMAAPFTLLVATVVRYAIWPAVLKNTGDSRNLRSVRNVFMHNMNAIFSLSEAALLGGIPVRWQDISFGPLVGFAYIIFSWSMTCRWNDSKKYGPQFIYFFLDTTMPGYFPSIALLALLSALMTFYAFFASAETVLHLIAPLGWPARVAFVLALSSTMMRFRD